MATQNNNFRPRQGDDFLRVRDLLYLCRSKWYWFIISLAVTLGIAAVYLLKTPPVYTRFATLLIKEDAKGNSAGDVAGIMGDMGFLTTNTNVYNEIQSLVSPAVMYDVVKRLHLDVSYTADGRFYKKTLYGQTCPYLADFAELPEYGYVSFSIIPGKDKGTVRLTDFVLDEDEFEGSADATLGEPAMTPVGTVTIAAGPAFDLWEGDPVYVSRAGLLSVAEAYSKGLEVTLPDENSTVIKLAFNDIDIQRADDLLNTLISVYNENWVKDKNRITVSTSMFINERLAIIERELGSVDEDIASYKSEHLLPDVQAAASMYMTQSSETSTQILALKTQLVMSRYVREYMTDNASGNRFLPANAGIENPGIEKQIADYNSLQLQRNSLAASSSDSNPLVSDMDQSLRSMLDAIISSIDNHIATLETQIKALEQNEQQTTAMIAANPSQGKYLLSVERQQKVKEALYLFLLQKREENELSQAFTAYNTRVITPPMGSLIPTSPVKRNIILVAFVMGLLIPVIIIFIRENMNTKLRGRKDLENLTVPFAGEIPLLSKKKGKAGKKEDETSGIVIRQGSRNIINEAFRILRTNLEFMSGTPADGKAPVILVTSFNPGSGKTFTTANIAASIALKGKKVLVVDCDLRRASLSKYVGSPHVGLSSFLARRKDDVVPMIVEVPGCPGLYVLPAGAIPPNPAELLADPRLGEMLSGMKGRYDYVFIDCPPVEIVADTQIIGKFADRTLFVVRAGLLERDMLPELQKAYDEKRYRNMSLVLNGTDSGGSLYGSRYGYKYGYGEGGYYSSAKDKE